MQSQELGLAVVDLVKDPHAEGSLTRSTTLTLKADKALAVKILHTGFRYERETVAQFIPLASQETRPSPRIFVRFRFYCVCFPMALDSLYPHSVLQGHRPYQRYE